MTRRLTSPTGRAVQRRAFTLIELMVVMGIVAILATITVIAVGAISRDAKLSSAKNTVVAALEQARGYAMREGQVVAVTFRANWNPNEPQKRQFTEVWFSKYADSCAIGSDGEFILDRFVPIDDLPTRALPPGIKVAGPWYDTNNDEIWVTQPDFREIKLNLETDGGGRFFAIMYGPEGDLRTHASETGANNLWVDYDRGGGGCNVNSPDDQDLGTDTNFWDYNEPEDESNLNPLPFVAVYDDDRVRELRTGNWLDEATYRSELSALITQYSDRIHFNRYSGVVLR